MFNDYRLCRIEAPVACVIMAHVYGFDAAVPI